jgi:hypothetical protein
MVDDLNVAQRHQNSAHLRGFGERGVWGFGLGIDLLLKAS